MGTRTLICCLAVFSFARGYHVALPTVSVDSLQDLTRLVNDSLPEVMYFPDDERHPRAGKIVGTAPFVPPQKQDVFFKLYTGNGPTEGTIIPPGDGDALERSTFNASKPTYFLSHGYLQSINSTAVRTLRAMLLGFREGNVFAVDWSKLSKSPFYFIVKLKTVQVGQFIGSFISFLVKAGGLDVSDVHLVGFGLGAHVVGIAGKIVQVIKGKKCGRITGLDPAGPLFSVDDKQHRLDKDDADFVDVIHTCGGWLGLKGAIGHVDFYPNRGSMIQPGCSVDLVSAGVCSHGRSWEFFAESINSQRFSAVSCSNYKDFTSGNCRNSSKASMGLPTSKNTVGTYYLKTSSTPPYALG